MSLLSEFENSLPMTHVSLENWLKRIIEEATPYTFDGINMSAVLAKSVNSTINDVLSVSNFNAIYNAIIAKKVLRMTIGTSTFVATTSSTTQVSVDNYKYIQFTLVGKLSAIASSSSMQVLNVEIEMLNSSIRLCGKTFTTI